MSVSGLLGYYPVSSDSPSVTGDFAAVSAEYARAGFRGRILPVAPSFAELPEIEEETEEVTAPVIAPSPAPLALVPQVAPATPGQYSAVAAARYDRQEAAFLDNGLAAAPRLVAVGTTLLESSERAFRSSRAKWQQTARIVDSLPTLIDAVRAENRIDVRMNLASLRMDQDGTIYKEGGSGNRLAFERNGLDALCRLTSKYMPAHNELLKMRTSLRANVFNEQIQAVGNKQATFRTRRACEDRPRAIYSVNGASYGEKGRFDADQIAAALIPAFGRVADDWRDSAPRGECVYRPADSSLTIDAIWHADTIVDQSANDVFKGGMRVTSADNGTGAVNGQIIVWRPHCTNLMVFDVATASLFRRVHRGDMSGVAFNLQEAVGKVSAFMASFAQDWGVLRRARVTSANLPGGRVDSPKAAIAALIKSKHIPTVAGADTLSLVMGGWQKEPGDSLAHVLDAITRCAWDSLLDDCQRDRMQRAAGELVPVLVRAA